MSPQPELQDETHNDPTSLSRRKLLKAVAAAGVGTSAAFFLPGKWLKPLVEVGVLPAHAQVSAGLHTFVSASARQVLVTGGPVFMEWIEVSCTITPGDAGIPILIKWQNQDGSVTYDEGVASTDAGGTLTAQSALYVTCDNARRIIFAFANAAQGTGTITTSCASEV